MWSHIVALVALAGFALSQSDDPFCVIKTLLEPLQAWIHHSGAYYYTLGPTDKKSIFRKGRTYQYIAPMLNVIPEEVYRENKEKIECGPMEIFEIAPGVQIAASTSKEATCGASGKLFKTVDRGTNPYYVDLMTHDPSDRFMGWVWLPVSQPDRCLKKEEVTTQTPLPSPTTLATIPTTTTTTPVPTLPPLSEKDIKNMTTPLRRYYSRPHIKHVYHPDANFVNSFYGADARHYTPETPLGKVLSYKTYAEKKEEIDQACPELVVYKSVFEPTVGNIRGYFDQSFYPLESVISAPLVDYGPIFVAAKVKGYCGANTPVYLVNSNRPGKKDWFYTQWKSEYDTTRTTNTFYRNPGNGRGVQFYIW